MAPQPHLPPSPAVAASSVAGRLPAGNLLPVEVVQVILRALWYLCPAAPMAAAVSLTFRSAAALTEHSLRACSFVKPRRFAVSVDSLPATMQLHSALTVAERLKLDRAVAPMGARTLWHNALYYNRTLTHDALLAVLGWRLPSTSTRTRGFLGDEEVNDLIGLSIPAVRRGMGAGESLYLPSTIFQNVDAYGSCCDLAVSMGFKAAEPELFVAMMSTPVWVVPCCSAIHWWAFFLHIPQRRILVADSLSMIHTQAAQAMLEWLSAAHRHHTGVYLHTSTWEIWHIAVPQQEDGAACGIFTWLAALHHSQKAPLDYTFAHIRFYREVAALLLLRIRKQPLIVSLD